MRVLDNMIMIGTSQYMAAFLPSCLNGTVRIFGGVTISCNAHDNTIS